MGITIGDAILYIKANSSGLDSDLNKTESKVSAWSSRIGSVLQTVGQLYTQAISGIVGAVISRGTDLEKIGVDITQILSNVNTLTYDTLASLSGAVLSKIADTVVKMDQLTQDYAASQEETQVRLADALVEIAEEAAQQLEDAAYDHAQRLADIADQMQELTQDYNDSRRDREQELKDDLSDLDQDYNDNRSDLLRDLSQAETKEQQERIRERIAELDREYQQRRARIERDAKQAEERARREFIQAQKRLKEKIDAENAQYARQTEQIKKEEKIRADAAKERFAQELLYAQEAYDRQYAMYQEMIDKTIAKETSNPFYEIQKGTKEVLDILGPVFMENLKVITGFIANTVIPILKKWAQSFVDASPATQQFILGLGSILFAAGKLFSGLAPFLAWMKIAFGTGGTVAGAGATATKFGLSLSGIGTVITGTLIPALGTIGTTIVSVVLSPITLLIAYIGLLIYTIINFGPQAMETLNMLLKIFVAWAERLSRDLGRWFINVGHSIVMGLWEGIQAGWAWLVDNVTALAQQLLDAVKDFLGIESPSKAFMVLGRALPQGIGAGWQEEMPNLVNQLQLSAAMLPVSVASGMSNVRVGTVEFHGALSRAEREELDRRAERRAVGVIERIL